MAQATWADIDEQTRELAGFPNFQRPNFAVRMSAYLRAARYYIRRKQAAPLPQLISSYQLPVNAQDSEYLVNRDDFAGVESCFSDPEFYPDEPVRSIGVVNYYQHLNSEGTNRGFYNSNQRVIKIATKEVLDSETGEIRNYIVTFPHGATDHVIINYKVRPNRDAPIADYCPLDEATALDLIPAFAIYHNLGAQFVWDSYPEGIGILDQRAGIIQSAKSILDTQDELFEQERFYPNKARATQNLQGTNFRRRLARNFRR